MHLSDLKDTCTYVCNMHSLLMHTGYTAISTANLNLSTSKHTFARHTARFSFLSPGEKNLALTFPFDSYLITYRVPPLLVNYINKFISFEVKKLSDPITADYCRIDPKVSEYVREGVIRSCPNFSDLSRERVHVVDDVLFGFVSNCTTLKTYFIYFYIFFFFFYKCFHKSIDVVQTSAIYRLDK